MAYTVENAIFQWQDGERRVRESDELARSDLERAIAAVEDELRKRLGSSFMVAELVELYGSGVDWAEDLAQRQPVGTDIPAVVDAAFARYARQATDFAGGQPVDRPEPVRDEPR